MNVFELVVTLCNKVAIINIMHNVKIGINMHENINEFIMLLLAFPTELVKVYRIWSKEENAKFSNVHFVAKIISIVKNKIIIRLKLITLFFIIPFYFNIDFYVVFYYL